MGNNEHNKLSLTVDGCKASSMNLAALGSLKILPLPTSFKI